MNDYSLVGRAAGFWKRLLDRLGRMDPFAGSMPAVGPTDPEGFSISLLALSAKIAKADGLITRDEVAVVRSILQVPPGEEKNAARVFNLCGQDPSGYEAYARKISRAIGHGAHADGLREDVLDALFHVAMADGEYHPNEASCLWTVAGIFAIPEARFRMIEARHVPDAWSPHEVLGVPSDAGEEEIRAAWKARVREEHPDRLAARGLPREMLEIAHRRMLDLNRAYEELTVRPGCSPA
ncbi:molecular chaperone DjiA [Defluviimonas salinarum]|uniref:Molecular chaperone DjiA n=1 Tax=Defluviimonas salinarum TaxID=2992147 RepID=A0ABT3J864_9RHOB|nr:molecular chaperone DjiA [Defluviimonas salinarum]MCW3783882.1 molecular chaperone DjiA [Defluviimonas salinarum]